jgi:hypothetical protein
MSWFGTRGIVLTKGYGFRNNSGNLAIFAAIRAAPSRSCLLPTYQCTHDDAKLMAASLLVEWVLVSTTGYPQYQIGQI